MSDRSLQNPRARDVYCTLLAVASAAAVIGAGALAYVGGTIPAIGVVFLGTLAVALFNIVCWIRVASGDWPSPGSEGRS